MTDAEFEQQLRTMSVRLAESSPVAPTFEEIQQRTTDLVTEVDVVPGNGEVGAPTGPGFWRKTMAVLGLGVAVGGGAFALAALIEDDGAQSPQAAVEEFIEAVAAEDVIGVGETLVDSERDLVLDNLEEMVAELQRLDVAGDDVDTRDVSGLEFTADMSSLRLQESPLSDTVTRIRILDGDLGLDADFRALPVGDSLREDDQLDDPDPVDLLIDVFGGQADVVAIRDSDGWHVSLLYTAAEYVRAEQGLPSTSLGGGPTPVGAESPEALLGALLDSVVTGDVTRAVTLADPVEAAVLYDYWSVFQPEIGADLESLLADGPYGEVNSYETEIRGDGPERVISVTAWDYSLTGSLAQRITFDGRCFDNVSEGYGSSDGSYEPPPTGGCIGDEIDYEGETWTARRSGLTELAVVERDGRWYVRPGQSLIEGWLASVALHDAGNGAIRADATFGLLLHAYPWPPAWSFSPFGAFDMGYGAGYEESVSSVAEPVFCDGLMDADDATMAVCLSDLFGTPATADEVAACRAETAAQTWADPMEEYWAIEGCVGQVLFPPTPQDLLIQELLACPGAESGVGAVDASPQDQQALIDCATALFENGTAPQEVIDAVAECVGVEPEALASVTDNQVLISCGVQVLSGSVPAEEETTVGTIFEAPEPPVVPTTVVGQQQAPTSTGPPTTDG